MKIAIFSDFFYPELSGITDSITLLSEYLAAHGHTIMIVAPKYSKKDYRLIEKTDIDDKYSANILIKRLPAVRYPSSLTGQGRIALPLGKGIYLMKKFKPDIIHTHSPYGPGLEGLLVSGLLKIPLIGTNHTIVPEFLNGPKVFVNAVLRYNSWYYNHCDFMSAPCRALIDEMKKYGFHGRSEAVSNPIAIEKFTPVTDEKEKEKLQRHFKLSGKVVLYTGRLSPEKRLDMVIKGFALALKKMPYLSLALAGHGIAEKSLRELSRQLGIEKSVKFLGFIDKETLPFLNKASDLFATMSTSESQSLSLMQAMAGGLPVIGANAYALPEYINKSNGIIVEPGDFNSLSEAIIEIFSDPSLAKKLGSGGIFSAAKCSPSAIGEKWEEIYNTAATNAKNHYEKS